MRARDSSVPRDPKTRHQDRIQESPSDGIYVVLRNSSRFQDQPMMWIRWSMLLSPNVGVEGGAEERSDEGTQQCARCWPLPSNAGLARVSVNVDIYRGPNSMQEGDGSRGKSQSWRRYCFVHRDIQDNLQDRAQV